MRRRAIRVCAVAAVCCLPLGASAADAKKDGKIHVAPGQAKKLPSAPAIQPPSVRVVTEQTAKTAPTASKPAKQHGPKKKAPEPTTPPAGDPPAAAQAPAPVTASPAAAPEAQPPVTADGTPAADPTPQPTARKRSARRPQRESRSALPRSRSTGATAIDSPAVSIAAVPSPATAVPTAAPTRAARPEPRKDDGGSVVTRTVRDIVETVPRWMKLALAALVALSLLLAAGYLFTALRARSLRRQRAELLSEVGLLQRALLPPVPETLGALKTSVAYRPADGPGAGGDFYDALLLPEGRTAFVLGDVSGHGRDAIERTAFMRYTLRAYLEAGLEPRMALQVAERAIGERLGGDFATVLLAVHDPRTASLTFASAGHPAPIVVGPGGRFEPVIAGSAPPIGIGEATGLRQTTVPLMPGSVACFYTDGLIEARTDDGLLGSERVEQIVAELGKDITAADLLERVSQEADTPDDMAACVLAPTAGITTGGFRTETLELSAEEIGGPLLGRFLDACDVPRATRDRAEAEALELTAAHDGAVVSVAFGARRAVEVFPRNVASIESAVARAV
jgi:serine phosphatase RsbU (regulator of sigma subunit)